VRAVLNIDYPSHKFRVVVSDDGDQSQVRQGVEKLATQFPHRKLFYTARTKTPATSHKAGNLNHAREFYNRLPGGRDPAPFFAGIDADMIVEKKWLRAQIGYLMTDASLAFTCPPPRFYNVPVDDPLSQSLLIFQRYEEIVKDRAGFPWCTGSGWIMRRTALDQAGGFPDGSLTEDLLLSNLILGKGKFTLFCLILAQCLTTCFLGWKAVYAMETLQWGLVPDSYHAHVQQRKRWVSRYCCDFANEIPFFFLLILRREYRLLVPPKPDFLCDSVSRDQKPVA
jgi:cellulose synthase/poly-beta-1,6-N-acetylglucosamine synthase-like glycosyltransferase